MFWLPVIFACAVTGECAFFYEDGLTTQKQCEKRVAEALRYFHANQGYKAAQGVCLDISAPKTSGGRI